MKYCPCCSQTKLFSDFSKNKSRKDGYMGYCKPCQQEKRKASDQKHNIERNEAAKKWRTENREAHLVTLKKYRDKNQALRTALQNKRKAAKLQRTPAWLTEFDLLKIKCLYQVAAMYSKESGQEWHVDHIVPLQGKNVSGLHCPDNLRVIPAVDNLRKNNRY
jgi:hypothetical protein